jgi:phosphoglycerate dehydrogenase-like enzyme
MNKIKVVVLIAPEDAVPFREGASPFQEAIEGNPRLRDRVALHFARAEERIDAIKDAEVVVCGKLSPELIAAAANLRWVSFWIAGLDNQVTPELEAHHVLITNASGVHAPNIAEQVLTYILMFTRRMPYYMRAQMARKWAHDEIISFEELTGQTLGIAGLGRVGEALAVRASRFGMRVIAVKRDISSRHDRAIISDALYPPEQLPEMLSKSDHVCIAMPYTRETHHLFNEVMLAHMKASAYLYNVSRGKIIDEQALIAALNNGKLRGAGLDVFESEPLAADSPLWGMENVIITPHVAGFTPHYFARAAALLADNLERFVGGRPLKNLYDPQKGY